MAKWIVYATSTCNWCRRAKEFLIERDEPVEYILLDDKTLPRFKKDFPTALTVPQIITPEGRKIGGYDNLVALFN